MVTGEKLKIVEFPIEDSLVKKYSMIRQGMHGSTIQVTIPKELLEKVARKNGLALDEFLELFYAAAYYGGGDEVLYRFERKLPSGK